MWNFHAFLLLFPLFSNTFSLSGANVIRVTFDENADIDTTTYDIKNELQNIPSQKGTIGNMISFMHIDNAKPFTTDGNYIRLSSVLDREAWCSSTECDKVTNVCCRDNLLVYQLEVEGTPSDQYKSIKLCVKDENDHKPIFSRAHDKVSVIEHQQGAYIDLPKADDNDCAENAIIDYKIRSERPRLRQLFNLSKDGNGKPFLLVTGDVDREVSDKYSFIFVATNIVKPFWSSEVNISLEVKDVNDNKPEFNQSNYLFHVVENARLGSIVGVLKIVDKDIYDNAYLSVRILEGTLVTRDFFSVSVYSDKKSRQGVYTFAIKLIGTLDYERSTKYVFSVIAEDRGKQPLTSTATVTISVDNIDDENIVISFIDNGKIKNEITKLEDDMSISITRSRFIAVVSVADKDTPNKLIKCNTPTEGFTLQSAHTPLIGNIYFNLRTNLTFDREKSGTIEVKVICFNKRDRSKFKHARLVIRIKDVNDSPPKFDRTHYNGNINENAPAHSRVKFKIPILATDTDVEARSATHYELIYPRGKIEMIPFDINKQSGKITTTHQLDYETTNRYQFLIKAYDADNKSLTTTATVSIQVGDVNDNAPIMSAEHYTFSVSEEVENAFVGNVTASDADGTDTNAAILYEIQPCRSNVYCSTDSSHLLRLDRTTGVITTHGRIDREKIDTIVLVVKARNKHRSITEVKTHRSSATVTVRIVDTNDHSPVLLNPHELKVEFQTREGGHIGESRCQDLHLEFKDADIGDNGKIELSLQNHTDMFKLEGVQSGDCSTALYCLCLQKKTSSQYRSGRSIILRFIASDVAEHSKRRSLPFDVTVYFKFEETAPPNRDRRDRERINSTSSPVDNQTIIIITIVILIGVFLIVCLIFFAFHFRRFCMFANNKDSYHESVQNDGVTRASNLAAVHEVHSTNSAQHIPGHADSDDAADLVGQQYSRHLATSPFLGVAAAGVGFAANTDDPFCGGGGGGGTLRPPSRSGIMRRDIHDDRDGRANTVAADATSNYAHPMAFPVATAEAYRRLLAASHCYEEMAISAGHVNHWQLDPIDHLESRRQRTNSASESAVYNRCNTVDRAASRQRRYHHQNPNHPSAAYYSRLQHHPQQTDPLLFCDKAASFTTSTKPLLSHSYIESSFV